MSSLKKNKQKFGIQDSHEMQEAATFGTQKFRQKLAQAAQQGKKGSEPTMPFSDRSLQERERSINRGDNTGDIDNENFCGNRTDNTFELYCPFQGKFRKIRATSLTQSVILAMKEFEDCKSEFEIKDIVFSRIETNPVFCMHSVAQNGFVARLTAKIHRDCIRPFWSDDRNGRTP